MHVGKTVAQEGATTSKDSSQKDAKKTSACSSSTQQTVIIPQQEELVVPGPVGKAKVPNPDFTPATEQSEDAVKNVFSPKNGVPPAGFELWNVLKKLPFQMTAEQLLALVPNFWEQMLHKMMEEKGEQLSSPDVLHTEPVSAPITDESVPVVNVRLNGTPVYGAFLDGGSGVNVLSNSLCAELGITKFESAPFAVKMADQRRVQPLGLVKDLDLDIAMASDSRLQQWFSRWKTLVVLIHYCLADCGFGKPK